MAEKRGGKGTEVRGSGGKENVEDDTFEESGAVAWRVKAEVEEEGYDDDEEEEAEEEGRRENGMVGVSS